MKLNSPNRGFHNGQLKVSTTCGKPEDLAGGTFFFSYGLDPSLSYFPDAIRVVEVFIIYIFFFIRQ